MCRLFPSLTAVGGLAAWAQAQLVSEPFAYPAGAALEGQINPGSALPWSTMSSSASDDDILINGSNLSYPGLYGSTGGSAAYGGSGKTERLSLGASAPITSGSAYYSMMFSVAGLGQLGTGNAFIAGFSNAEGSSPLQPTTIGARLYLRQGQTSTPQSPTFNLGISKNSSNSDDIAFDTTEFPLNTPVLVVANYQINGAGTGTDDVARLYINPQASSLGAAVAPTNPTSSSPILTAPVVGTDLTTSGTPALAGILLRQGSVSVPDVQVDELRVDPTWAQVTPPAGTTWNANADGNWSDSTKWSGKSIPDSPDSFVTFGPINNATRTITLTAPVGLRTLNFASSRSYVIAGSQPLNFSTSSAINVIGPAGSHTISAPVSLGGDFEANIRSGSTLTLSGNLSANGHSIRKTGAGALQVNTLSAAGLSIVGGVVALAPGGASASVSRLDSIAIGPAAQLDLRNNDLIVGGNSTGTWNGSSYGGVSGLVASGRNGGQWNGGGIITSALSPGERLHTLGVAKAGDVLRISDSATGTFDGQVVHGSDTLVKYTYGGDANLDGRINIDDYGRIDSNIGRSGQVFGYLNGDFNYDGKINIDDYGIIDANIGAQGSPLVHAPSAPEMQAASGLTGIEAVPEPGTVALGLLLLPMLAKRQRRRGSLSTSTCST
jgi:hypothetical protein